MTIIGCNKVLEQYGEVLCLIVAKDSEWFDPHNISYIR